MKKIAFILMMVCCLANTYAQKREGEWSFIPRLGMNMSNLGDMDLYYINMDLNGETHSNSAIRTDVMAGAEVEYQALSQLGVSIGAFYSRQGCRWKEGYEQLTSTTAEGWDHNKVTLEYVNIPVTANFYVNDYLSFRAGLQCGIYLDGNWSYNLADIAINEKTGQKTNGDATHCSNDMQKMNSLVWSIPVGFGIEYENVLLDVRYNIPLTNFSKFEGYDKGGNRVITFSVGYRF